MRELKTAITVKLASGMSRKFQFSEWHSRDAALEVAKVFAQAASKFVLRMEVAKNKAEREAYLKHHVPDLELKKRATIDQIKLLLQEAGIWKK